MNVQLIGDRLQSLQHTPCGKYRSVTVMRILLLLGWLWTDSINPLTHTHTQLASASTVCSVHFSSTGEIIPNRDEGRMDHPSLARREYLSCQCCSDLLAIKFIRLSRGCGMKFPSLGGFRRDGGWRESDDSLDSLLSFLVFSCQGSIPSVVLLGSLMGFFNVFLINRL